jgi:hypothetical protein
MPAPPLPPPVLVKDILKDYVQVISQRKVAPSRDSSASIDLDSKNVVILIREYKLLAGKASRSESEDAHLDSLRAALAAKKIVLT